MTPRPTPTGAPNDPRMQRCPGRTATADADTPPVRLLAVSDEPEPALRLRAQPRADRRSRRDPRLRRSRARLPRLPRRRLPRAAALRPRQPRPWRELAGDAAKLCPARSTARARRSPASALVGLSWPGDTAPAARDARRTAAWRQVVRPAHAHAAAQRPLIVSATSRRAAWATRPRTTTTAALPRTMAVPAAAADAVAARPHVDGRGARLARHVGRHDVVNVTGAVLIEIGATAATIR